MTGLWDWCLRALNRKKPSPLNADALVETLYRKLLLREPDASGLAVFTAGLRDGRMSPSDMIDAILTSPEFFANRANFSRHYYPVGEDGFFAELSQFGEISILLRRMIDMSCTNKIVVDLGVMGRAGSNSFDLLRSFGWTGLLIEANSQLIDQIEAEFGSMDYRIVNSAVSDRAGTATLHIGSSDGVSSLDQRHSQRFGPTRGTVTVRLETLPTILEREKIPLHFDLLSIDIEGEDISVLNHMMESSHFRPNWIIVEAGNGHAYRPASLRLVPAFDEAYEAVGHTQANLIFRRRALLTQFRGHDPDQNSMR